MEFYLRRHLRSQQPGSLDLVQRDALAFGLRCSARLFVFSLVKEEILIFWYFSFFRFLWQCGPMLFWLVDWLSWRQLLNFSPLLVSPLCLQEAGGESVQR